MPEAILSQGGTKMMILGRKFLIMGIFLLIIASAGCTGGSESTTATPTEETATTPPPATTLPAVTTPPPVEEVDYTIISFYDPVGGVNVDGKVYLEYLLYGKTKDGEIKIQHADIPEKETTMLGEPKYILEYVGVVSNNPVKKTFTLTQTELFSPELTLEVRQKPL
jgi:hypothetical protein